MQYSIIKSLKLSAIIFAAALLIVLTSSAKGYESNITPESQITPVDCHQGNDHSFAPSISADGRFIAYGSQATNLVPNDTNGMPDIFVYDWETKMTRRVSIATDGTEANSWSDRASISANGRFVTFMSNASNLVTDDANNAWDTFVHDLETSITTRVSNSSGGFAPSISADGRFIAYYSFFSGSFDILVHDRETGNTFNVPYPSFDLGLDAVERGVFSSPAISENGNYIAFYSLGSNTSDNTGIFVYDSVLDNISPVTNDGIPGNSPSGSPDISADGQYVAFESFANPGTSVFVHFRDRDMGFTTLVSEAATKPSISADGQLIAYELEGERSISNIFVYDLGIGDTVPISMGLDGIDSNSNGKSGNPSISGNGRFVAFDSFASNLVPDDTNEKQDIFIYDLNELDEQTLVRISKPSVNCNLSLSVEFDQTLENKQLLIDELGSPPFELFDFKFNVPTELAPEWWGYDEEDAQILLDSLQEDFAKFNADEMSLDEQAVFIAKAEAFERFYLSEKALQNTYPLSAETAFAMSDSIITLISMFMGYRDAIGELTENAIKEGGPFNDAIESIGSKLSIKLLEVLDRRINLLTILIEDQDWKDSISNTIEIAFYAVKLKLDVALGTREGVEEILIDQLLHPTIASSIQSFYFQETQFIIDDPVESISQNPEELLITGSLEGAELHVELYHTYATINAERMATQHERFRDAIKVSEYATSLGDLGSATSLVGGTWGVILKTIPRAMTLVTDSFDGYCQTQLMIYLTENVEGAYDHAFNAKQVSPENSFTQCDFSWRPEDSETPEIISTTMQENHLASNGLFFTPEIDNRATITSLPLGDAISVFQQQLEEYNTFISIGDANAAANSIDILLRTNDQVSEEITLLLAPIATDLYSEESSVFQNSAIEFELQTAFLYTSLIVYFANPSDVEVQSTILTQIEQMDHTLDILSNMSIPMPHKDETNDLPASIFLSVDVPSWSAINEPTVITATVANISSLTSNFTLQLTDQDEIINESSSFAISADNRRVISITVPGLQEGSYLFFLKMIGENGKFLDSTPIILDVISPELKEPLNETPDSIQQNNESSSIASSETETNSVESSENSNRDNEQLVVNRTRLIIIGFGIIVLILGIGIVLSRHKRI